MQSQVPSSEAVMRLCSWTVTAGLTVWLNARFETNDRALLTELLQEFGGRAGEAHINTPGVSIHKQLTPHRQYIAGNGV